MSTTERKTDEKSPASVPAKYSEELPATPEERARALPDFSREAAVKQKGPDPRDAEAPYSGGSFNGTDDSSRFSTPPAKKT